MPIAAPSLASLARPSGAFAMVAPDGELDDRLERISVPRLQALAERVDEAARPWQAAGART